MDSGANAAKMRYQAALDSFVEKLRDDINVIAVVIAGSMAYDVVWEKSDMDVTVVVRDQKLESGSFCVDEDGIIINADIMTKTNFCRMLERGWSTAYARARIVYTEDDSLYEFLESVQGLGGGDIEMNFFRSACFLIGHMEKIEKWLTVKNDLQYAQSYVLGAANGLAWMELTRRGVPPNRESVLKLLELDYDLIAPYYIRPMSGPMSRDEIQAALDGLRSYLITHLELLKKPVTEFMSDGEMKTVTMLTRHFGTDSHSIYHVFDFLTEMDVVIKTTNTIRITPKGRQVVDEVGFMMIQELQQA